VPKGKISSGIDKLDALIDSFHIGDNVIWEVVAGSSHEHFIRGFLSGTNRNANKTIYISFNHSPQSILNRYSNVVGEKFILIDCFTSGKGKDDHTFSRYYENGHPANVIRINRPGDIDLFTKRLNEIEDSLEVGACYVFDSLTGMQDLWGSEEKTYKFFTYMCPRLFDLETVAYWIMEKDAHSSNFKANLRHITQVVFELSKRNDNMFIQALKLDGRQEREAFKSQRYRVYKDKVLLLPGQRDITSDIDLGSKVRKLRNLADMSQKELADKVGLTASSISQLENNQISPTMNNFVLICNALNISPAEFWKEKKEPSWIIRAKNLQDDEKAELFSAGNVTGLLRVVGPGKTMRHSPDNSMFVYVLRGTASVASGRDRFKLLEGDAAMLKKGLSPVWKNSGNTSARLLCLKL
jgi:transcriptional regulator with XRE-family HTH domain/KaiC/GvpD/RAD55 family RecA-like ATPase